MAKAEDVAKLEARVAELEQENNALKANAPDVDAMNSRIAELEQANGDLTKDADAMTSTIDALRAENETLKAAQDGGNAKDVGKAERGEEIPDFLKPDYTGPVDVTKAEKIAAQRKKETEAKKAEQGD